jgi:hypothetical protein
MLCVELAEILEPQKTIIISSARNRSDFPRRYKFQKAVPIHQYIPASILLASAKFLQPIVEPDRNKHPETFKAMLASKDAVYMKRTIDMILNWDRTSNSKQIYHIHGTSDRTLPMHAIKSADYVVDKGSHLMALTRADEINRIVGEIVNKKSSN